MQNLLKQLWSQISNQIEENTKNFLKPEPIVLRKKLDEAASYISSTIDKKKFIDYIRENDNSGRRL